jgi:hypothetical protein
MKININNRKIKSLVLLSLVGSGLGKEENSKNQTQINLNSLPQLATNLTKREDSPDQTLFYAGYPIDFGPPVDYWKATCSSGFAIVPSDVNDPGICAWGSSVGLITSATCCTDANCESKEVVSVSNDKSIKVGHVQKTLYNYIQGNPNSSNFFTGTDFAVLEVSESENNIKLAPYVVGAKDFIPVTSYGSVPIGTWVCAYTAGNGYMCGNVVALDERAPISYPKYIAFIGLGKISVENTDNYIDEYDLGGPVYVESNIGDRTIAQIVGHISWYDYDENDKGIIYYTPIEKSLEMLATQNNCRYVPMTYNETNAEEFQKLLAQVEIPVKN